MKTKLTITPDPEVVVLEAARRLRRIGLPANGTFLSAAEALMERDVPVTQDNLANALHEES